jgi:hypothetical protein
MGLFSSDPKKKIASLRDQIADDQAMIARMKAGNFSNGKDIIADRKAHIAHCKAEIAKLKD